MALSSPLSPLHLVSSLGFKNPKPESFRRHVAMLSAPKPEPSTRGAHHVPDLNPDETRNAVNTAFTRHSSSEASRPSDPKRTGDGVAIVWFRNDLRLLDNEALLRAWVGSTKVVPVYCFDPRTYSATTSYFGFPKTGGLRAKFMIECVGDLKRSLMVRGLNLLVRNGKPEDVLPYIAKAFGAHTVFAQKETCSEELLVERLVMKGLQQAAVLPEGESSSNRKPRNTKLQLIWGATMYHIDDLLFDVNCIPDVYTQFRKSVEAKCSIRHCCKLPVSLGPPPSNSMEEVGGWGTIPSLKDLGLHETNCEEGMHFIGGETAALSRVHEYFWKKDLLRVYKETRNGMVGPDYSTKFSPWLASGSLSPRYIYEEVKRYEKERLANDSTYWVLFELIWRDYFRFISIKYGNSIFHIGGPRKVVHKWSQDPSLFESWRDGRTGYPLIDANMKELSTTGFMSNRGRQVIFFTDPVDEYLMQYLMDYEDKKFQNVSKEGLKLGKDSKLKDLKESFKELTDWWKNTLSSENVDSVKISNRLDNTPCVVVTSKFGWSANMEKIMQSQTLSDASKQAYMRGKRVLEINPRHPIIKELRERVALDPKDESVKQTAKLIYQTALMESGFLLNDPKEFASSIYDSVKASLKINPDAAVEEEDDVEETEVEEKESTATKETEDAATEEDFSAHDEL